VFYCWKSQQRTRLGSLQLALCIGGYIGCILVRIRALAVARMRGERVVREEEVDVVTRGNSRCWSLSRDLVC
jgi:hypothetical protein